MCHVMSAACRGRGPGLVAEGRCKEGEQSVETRLQNIGDQLRYHGQSWICIVDTYYTVPAQLVWVESISSTFSEYPCVLSLGIYFLSYLLILSS